MTRGFITEGDEQRFSHISHHWPPGVLPLFNFQTIIFNQMYPTLRYIRSKRQRVVLTPHTPPIMAAKPRECKKYKVYQLTPNNDVGIHKD